MEMQLKKIKREDENKKWLILIFLINTKTILGKNNKNKTRSHQNLQMF